MTTEDASPGNRSSEDVGERPGSRRPVLVLDLLDLMNGVIEGMTRAEIGTLRHPGFATAIPAAAVRASLVSNAFWNDARSVSSTFLGMPFGANTARDCCTGVS